MFFLNIICAFLTTLIFLTILRPLAVMFKLVDYPTKRKDHVGNIPLIGGICIFFGILSSYIFIIEFDFFFGGLLTTASFILIHGVLDDVMNLKATAKMAFQAFLTFIMIYLTDVKLDSLGYIFGFSEPLDLGMFSIPITIIAVVGLTNAINMIDGIDGLATSLVLIVIATLIFNSLQQETTILTNVLFAIISALLPFLFFNIAPYNKIKVFLGDGGSLFLGYMVSWMLIYSSQNMNNFTHTFALWCVAIPLFDFFTVIIVRIIEKRSLFKADKDHIHHLIKILGFSKNLSLIIIVSTGIIILLIGLFIENDFPALSFPVFFALFLFYLFTRIYYRSKKNLKHIN